MDSGSSTEGDYEVERKHRNHYKIAGVIGLVSALTFAGCTAGDLAGGSSTTEGKTTITFLVNNSDSSSKAADAVIAAFEAENPEINVEKEVKSAGTDGTNLMKTRLATGDMADVFEYDSGALLAAIHPTENLVPLTDEAWVEQLEPLFQDAVTVEGDIYGAAYSTGSGGGMLYNIPLYERLGLEVPKTWDEFMANVEVIAADGQAAPVEQTFGETWTSQLLILADYNNVAAEVPDFADRYTKGEAKFSNTPAAQVGFDHIQDLYEAGYFNKDFASATMNDGLLAVATGTAAHYPQLGSVAGNIENVSPGGLENVGFFAQPGTSADTNGMTVWPGSSALYIPKTTTGAELEAAKKFIAFTQTQTGCDAYASGYAPQGPFMTKACTLPEDVSQVAKDTQSYFESGKITPALEFLSPVKGPALEQIAIQVGTGQISAAEGAKAYDEDARKQALQLNLDGWE